MERETGESTVAAIAIDETRATDATALLIGRIRAALTAATENDLLLARQCLVDWAGVLLAAAETPYRTSATGWTDAVGDRDGGGATDLVHDRRVGVAAAAMTNGMLSHVLDFDDVHLDVPGHTGVATIPAALAVSEAHGLDLHRLSRGIIAGVETMAWLGRVMAPGHHRAGWHPTAVLGAIGAAVAAAVALDFDDVHLRSAIALSALQGSGLQQAFGTEGKSWQVGTASRNGVDAVNAVRAGVRCDDDMLGGERGFIAAYGGAPASFGSAVAADATRDRVAIRDTIFKMHASCFSTHAAIEAAIVLRDRYSITPDQIEQYSVRVGTGFASVVEHRAPSTALEAKFSATTTVAMPFLAITTVRPDAFTETLVAHQPLVALEARGAFEHGTDVPDNGALVTVRLSTGEVHTAAEDCPAPTTDLPAQQGRLHEKFRQLVAGATNTGSVDGFLAAMHEGGEVPVADLMTMLGEIRRSIPSAAKSR